MNVNMFHTADKMVISLSSILPYNSVIYQLKSEVMACSKREPNPITFHFFMISGEVRIVNALSVNNNTVALLIDL